MNLSSGLHAETRPDEVGARIEAIERRSLARIFLAEPAAGFERGKADETFFSDGRFASRCPIDVGCADETDVLPPLPEETARHA